MGYSFDYNLITMTGVSTFLFPYLYYDSNRAMIIFINGILYHGTNNKILKYNDITWNVLIILYTTYYYKTSRKYAVLGTLFWILNNWMYSDSKSSIPSIIHVCGTQWICLRGLLKSLHEKKLIKNI